MKHLPIDLSAVINSQGLLGLIGLLPDLKASIVSEEEQHKFNVVVSELKNLECSLAYLPTPDLEAAQKELKPLADLGTFVATLSGNDNEFLPFFEGILGSQIAHQMVELMSLAYSIHQKIHVILTEPDPDENDPDFQQFLIDWAIESESEGVPTKASFSARESLGL
jgi:hypothetical protein